MADYKCFKAVQYHVIARFTHNNSNEDEKQST